MCRLYGFRANEPTKVECSLVLAQNALLTQSRGDRRGKEHADGWGIATYEDTTPVVCKRETAAFETLHFSTTAERVYARTVLAHVRRATVSRPALANTHPFSCGVWTFAHNGTLHGFDDVAPILERDIPPALSAERRGSTDSELMFFWTLARMQRARIALDVPCGDPAALADVVRRGIRELARLSGAAAAKPAELNFLLTDGRTLLATRWNNSLFWVVRDGVHDCEVCGIPHLHHDPRVRYRAVVVASEPITHEAWMEVPEGAVVLVGPDLDAELLAAA